MKNKNILYADEHVENSFEILKKKTKSKQVIDNYDNH